MQLGDILVDEGLLTPEQLSQAQRLQNGNGRSLSRILVEEGFVRERDVVAALAAGIGMEFVDLAEADIDPSAVGTVSDAVARRHMALPIRYEGDQLVVAMSDPANVFALDDLRTLTGMDIHPVIATREDIEEAINRHHRMAEEIEAIGEGLAGEDDHDADLTGLREITEEAPIVKFVNLLISQAVQDGASDIHIEPGERDVRVRYRIDGVLHEVMRSPKSIQRGVISRLKIMAEVDIAERRIPQDGRISLMVSGRHIDLRFSTLPTVYGEKIVMRVLDKSSVLMDLGDLGFLPHNEKVYERSYRQPYGMILVTGPTGSGKSTTLYATVNVLARPEVNVVTVEDPVEYQLSEINQLQVNRKVGLTFATALRSILRQDPDILLVGEMRDHETAQIGVEAALTGHLVLSTLHTNDAASAITRLTEMGVEPFLVGSATDCVLAQRLVRRVCDKCSELLEPSEALLEQAGFSPEVVAERPAVPRAVGCKACGGTGYRGRLAVHEVMPVSEEIERLCVDRESSDVIKQVAIEQGMRTLRQDGLEKVLMGSTTIEEIARVIV